ncbi:cyclodeaminase [Bacillus sp. PK3_68]|uniref:cyclodeaminase n=1 Tax=Bacillus sp. PK3_68 TaxID=2027408 RepID=UPI000E72EA7A|nr:cyclodeaminase [Bacillus sp. PK3_68]RJS59059.1 cyclodeaminase [Bacillus sp. PK3_68]
MIIFTEKEIRSHVQLNNEAIHAVEEAFTELAMNKVTMPPIMRVDIKENNGEVDVKTAYVAQKDLFALKVSSGFFNNDQLGLPSANGFMVLISTKTGEPKALLLDNGYLTEVRTAAAGAVAAKYLAKKTIHTAGVIGTGAQAKYQMKALKMVRDYKKLLVYGRSELNMKKFKEEMEAILDVKVIECSSPEEVVKGSEAVVTTTPAKEPIVQAEWLNRGLHITAMGSDAEDKQELEADVLQRADRIVCDAKSQCLRLGELHHAVSRGMSDVENCVIELGTITSTHTHGRQNNREITVCDLTGTGVQDTAIALYAYERLMASGKLGLKIENKKEISFI